MKHLFYVRHGQTQFNVEGRLSGRIETPLTDAGREEAKLTGQKLKTLARIDYIICSPYERARETATIVAKELGFPVGKIEVNDVLVERTFGVLEGTLGKDFLDYHHYKDFDGVEGAETIEQLQHRAAKALAYIKNIPAENILVVGHGAFGRAFRRVTLELPHTDEYIAEFKIGNAEVLELV